ncbi:MAG: hypothetical protein L6264_05570 [Weeksellaceae bacterium]|nr:hypothetical protein [Bacteroidota bacterium]MCG2780399.1 hypothetical protein [Weeksellaceae bacterium]
MKTTVVGLFSSCEEAVKAAKNLKNQGYKILKLACKDLSAKRKSLFEEFFGSFSTSFGLKTEQPSEDSSENLVAGIFSKNVEKLENAKRILNDSGAIHVFSFENMSKAESRSKAFIMKMIGLHAKSEIQQTPSIKHHIYHEGISMMT